MHKTSDLLDELTTDFGGELVTLNEFSELAGFEASTAAQLRAERKRNQASFPPVVAESGRSFLHRLDELVAWVAGSRYKKFVQDEPGYVAAWRLERRMRHAAEKIGVAPARQLLAAAAVLAADDPDSDGSQLVERLRSAAAGERREQTERRKQEEQKEHGERRGQAERRKEEEDSEQRRLVGDLLADVPLDDEVVTPVIVELARQTTTAAVVDQAIGDLGAHQPGVARRTSEGIATLVALLLDVGEGDTIYEPTSGECEILLKASQLAVAQSAPPAAVYGSDHDPGPSLIGRARLKLAGIDAQIGTDFAPRPGSINRLVIDTGSAIDRSLISRWVRLLHRDGRVVVVTRLPLSGSPDLLAELWPTSIVFPPQRSATSSGAVVIWVSEPFRDPPSETSVVDLRTNDDTQVPVAERIAMVCAAAGVDLERRRPHDEQWQQLFDAAIPVRPKIVNISIDDLEAEVERAIAGTLGHPAHVVADNQRFARSLALELARLIGGADTEREPDLMPSRPETSPNGVLAGLTTDEARRVIARLVDALDQSSVRDHT